MKGIHIRKPDIKGFFTKVRNLKKEDIKRHFKEKKERRQRILEERRNSRFAKKMQPVYKWMNRFSLPLQFLLACVINFLIETVSRLSFFEAWDYLVGTPLVFLYNAFMIFTTFMLVYLFRRRVFARILISVFWLFLGICNGYLLTKRVTPFNAQDLKVLSDALELTGNYFNTFELVMIIVGVVAVVFWIVSMWRRGGQYSGKMHRIIALCGVGISFAACLWLTDEAIDKRVISNYFGNIAFAYEDYGFPYCFSASLFNTGINEPAGYSEETMNEISDNGELTQSTTGLSEDEMPNIMFVQLESFFDPTEVEWLRFSEDPIPNLRKLFDEYQCDYIVLDTNGIGLGVYDCLARDIVDTETGEIYPAVSCCNNSEMAERCTVIGAEKVVWSIKASAQFNSDCAYLLREAFRSGRIRLLCTEYEADEILSDIRGYSSLSASEKLELQMPYINTTLLVDELTKLQHEESGGKVRVFERTGMRKDRYSSLSYNYYVAVQLENKMSKRQSISATSSDVFVIKPPSYKGKTKGKAVSTINVKNKRASWLY